MNGHVCSITGGTVSRRDFLLSLLSLLAAPAAGTGAAGAVPTHDLPPWLAAISGSPEAVLRFGAAYLQLYPEERDREAIIAAIESRMADLPGGGATAGCTVDQLLILQRVVRGEYLRGEFVRIAGWSLSRTEARIYAAVALWSAPDQ